MKKLLSLAASISLLMSQHAIAYMPPMHECGNLECDGDEDAVSCSSDCSAASSSESSVQTPLPNTAPAIVGGIITRAFQGQNAIQRGIITERARSVSGTQTDWGRRNDANVPGNASMGNLWLATTEWTHRYVLCPNGYTLINNTPSNVIERSLGATINFVGRPVAGPDNGFRELDAGVSRPFPESEVQITAIDERPARIGGVNVILWGPVTRSRALSAETSTYIRLIPDFPWSYHHVSGVWPGVQNWLYSFTPVCIRPAPVNGGGGLCTDGFCSTLNACLIETTNVSTCGNMMCDSDENALTCPIDCPAPLYCPAMTVDTTLLCDINTVIFQGDGCTAPCQSATFTSATCGNSVIDGSEQCDDGNTFNGDGCNEICETEASGLCPMPSCGNAVIEAGEACDDGNAVNNDGCTSVCVVESCGDWITQSSEQCDDGNTASGDGCTASCMYEYCGDSTVQGTETCDDGNVVNGDGCDSSCAIETTSSCGNWICDSTETIASCPSDCTSASSSSAPIEYCGDSIVQATETCDDGNVVNGDGCDSLCAIEL